jgi:hypothetical protein
MEDDLAYAGPPLLGSSRLRRHCIRLDEALACLHTFIARYPPHTVRATSLPQAEQKLHEMRTTLVALADRGCPLVRLMTPLDVQDESVLQLLLFAMSKRYITGS